MNECAGCNCDDVKWNGNSFCVTNIYRYIISQSVSISLPVIVLFSRELFIGLSGSEANLPLRFSFTTFWSLLHCNCFSNFDKQLSYDINNGTAFRIETRASNSISSNDETTPSHATNDSLVTTNDLKLPTLRIYASVLIIFYTILFCKLWCMWNNKTFHFQSNQIFSFRFL